MVLKDVLKRLMHSQGLTSKQLAKNTKVPEGTIKTWLSGSNPRSMDDVRSVARFFNVDLEFLLFGDEAKAPKDLDSLPLEDVYEGWVKVKVQRAVRTKNKNET